MKLISHRGNIDGRLESKENEPTYIDLAISKGYEVEVDVWFKDNTLWLGHDRSQYEVDFRWFIDRISKIWIHCKNIEAITFFNDNFEFYPFNYFWHESDTITLTSLNYIWVYPGKQPIKNSISVLPELYDDNISSCIGICSDIIEKYNKTI
jgi:hypothetical protein